MNEFRLNPMDSVLAGSRLKFRCKNNLCVLVALCFAWPLLGQTVNEKPQPISLYYASMAGSIDLMQRLISEKKDVNEQILPTEGVPLHAAVMSGNPEAVKLLLANGANVSAKNRDGISPLHLAAAKGQLDVCKLLLDKDATVDELDNAGWTPLVYATRSGQVKVMELLIEKKANVNAADPMGATPLIWTALLNRAESAKLLLEKGADAEMKDSAGMTAADHAQTAGAMDTLEVLDSRGAGR